MKIQALLFLSFGILISGCTLVNDQVAPQQTSIIKNFANFDIYVELLPDTTLNIDEQSHQAYALRLMSRAGYSITIYQFNDSQNGETVILRGVTNDVGNYKATGLDEDTYRIVIADGKGPTQEIVTAVTKGHFTKLTFSFYIPA